MPEENGLTTQVNLTVRIVELYKEHQQIIDITYPGPDRDAALSAFEIEVAEITAKLKET